MKKILFLLSLCFYLAQTKAQDQLNGIIANNQVWTKAQSPYTINKVLVTEGTTITVEAGAKIIIQDRLVIEGVLLLQGTEKDTTVVEGGVLTYSNRQVGQIIQYCLFNSTQINTSRKGMVQNCLFLPQSTLSICGHFTVKDCAFQGSNLLFGRGKTFVLNSTFDKCRGLMVGNNTEIRHCRFSNTVDWVSVRVAQHLPAIMGNRITVEDNIFENNTKSDKSTVALVIALNAQLPFNLPWFPNNRKIIIQNNTFKNNDVHIQVETSDDLKYAVKNNTFLTANKYTIQTYKSGSGGSLRTYDFTHNTWDKRTKEQIQKSIFDNRIDFEQFGKIEF
jgi:hypothetical protein